MSERYRLTKQQRRAIRDRLNDQIKRSPYRNRYRLERALNLTHSAVAGWLNSKNPVTPDTLSLYRLSDALGFSIDWLLFGEGPDQRGAVRHSDDFATDLRTQLVATLKQRGAFNDRTLATFIPRDSGDLLWQSIVSNFAWMLLDQARDEYRRKVADDFFGWAIKSGLSDRKHKIRPFYDVEKSRPF